MEQDLSYFKNFGEQVEQRLNKLAHFTERGQLPYPPRVTRNHTTAEAVQMYEAAEALSDGSALPEGSALPKNNEDKPQINVEVAGRWLFAKWARAPLLIFKMAPAAFNCISEKMIWGTRLISSLPKILIWATL